MTGVTFKTPFYVLLGVVLLPLLSVKNFESALSGFISEPLFWSSAFACGELAFLLLVLKFNESTYTSLMNAAGQVLSFCYGVLVTIVLALAVKYIALIKVAVIFCGVLTILMLVVDVAYSGRFASINNYFSSRFNEAATNFAVMVLIIVMILLAVVLYFFWVFVKL